MANVFMAGFGSGNISPEESVPMQGFGNHACRMSTNNKSEIYSLCLAVRDAEGNTAIIISVDSAAVGIQLCDEIQDAITEKTGVPQDHIFITSIHQHCSPDHSCWEVPSAIRYRKMMTERTAEAAAAAIADLAPAEMYIATVKTEGLTFVKHYIMNDGTYGGDLFGNFASGIRCHETEADSDLQIVKFVREGAREILFCNFQGHPHRGTSGKDTNVHADMPGAFREEAEALLDAHVIYVSGAQGNLNMHSRVKEEMKTPNYIEDGKALAQYALQAEGTYKKVNTGKVQATEITYTANTDHSMDYLLEEARTIAEHWWETNDGKAAMALATSGKIHSVYHADAIIDKQEQGPTRDFNVMAVSFGDIAICGGPYEMFDTNGMEIKAGSPFAMTFVGNMTNGTIGYVPSQMGYDHGCYPADITRLAPGSGELLRDQYLKMLKEQRAAQ